MRSLFERIYVWAPTHSNFQNSFQNSYQNSYQNSFHKKCYWIATLGPRIGIALSAAGVLWAGHIQHRQGAPEALRAQHRRRGGRRQGRYQPGHRAVPWGPRPDRHREHGRRRVRTEGAGAAREPHVDQRRGQMGALQRRRGLWAQGGPGGEKDVHA